MTEELYSIHQDPVWRDRANFIINAALPEEGRYEQLWTRQVSEDSFELCCIPFFLYDVALGDVVQTREVGGEEFILDKVVRPSGRYVLRAYFETENQSHRERTSARLVELGALIEWSSESLLAADARDAGHMQEIADYLWGEQQLGRLVYESGKR